MKRIAVLATLATALALPTAATAAKTWHYSGTLTDDPSGPGHVSFDLLKKKGKKRAQNFAAERIPSLCDNGASEALLDFTGLEPTKVKKAKFRFKGEADSGAVAKFAGRLSDHWSTVHGTVSWKGLIKVDQTVRDCHTGKVRFAGSRTEILTGRTTKGVPKR